MASDCVIDTGAIASSRAAKIYGLDVLAERIQVRLHLHVLEDLAAKVYGLSFWLSFVTWFFMHGI